MPAATLRCISMKALARYQVILLGEQRHIRCEQLAHGCCPNSAAVGVEPATSRSRVQRSNLYTTEPPRWCSGVVLCRIIMRGASSTLQKLGVLASVPLKLHLCVGDV